MEHFGSNHFFFKQFEPLFWFVLKCPCFTIFFMQFICWFSIWRQICRLGKYATLIGANKKHFISCTYFYTFTDAPHLLQYYSMCFCFYLHIKSNLCITKIPWIKPCWHKTTHRFTQQQRKWLYVILSQRCHSSCLFVCNLIGPGGQRSHTLSSSFHPSVFTKTQRFF